MSVRIPKDTKLILIFGQDKAAYRSSQQNDSFWTVDGENAIRTKGLDTGVMVSAFVSHALVIGLRILENKLLEINKLRVGKSYADEEAAAFLKGYSRKLDLADSPFIQHLNHRTGKDGCWTYRHMVLKIGDYGDCLKYLFPEFYYIF